MKAFSETLSKHCSESYDAVGVIKLLVLVTSVCRIVKCL